MEALAVVQHKKSLLHQWEQETKQSIDTNKLLETGFAGLWPKKNSQKPWLLFIGASR